MEHAEKEVYILERYKSEYIVKYRESFMHSSKKTGEVFVIIMDYCKCKIYFMISIVGDLKDFINTYGGKDYNLKIYLRIFSCILSGLLEVHSKLEQHRDLAPKNIFLDGDLNKIEKIVAKLGDFGLSIDVNHGNVTEISKFEGTL